MLAARPERVLGHLDLASDSTSGVRVLLWRSALEMLRDHPLFGIGLDNFVHRYNPERGGDYMSPEGWREPDLSHPHNLLLDWWLSLGVLGALVLARLLVVAWRLGSGGLARDRGDRLGRALVAGLVGSLVATLVHGAVDNSFFLPDLAALWWAGYALLAMLAEPDRDRGASPCSADGCHRCPTPIRLGGGRGAQAASLAPQQRHDRGLLRPQVVQRLGQLALDALAHDLERSALEVGLDHGRVDVALPADRRRVAEPLGDRLDRAHDVLLRLGLAVERLDLLERLRGQDGAGPGAEVLGREVVAGDLAQVLVDVGRADVARLPRRRRRTGTAPGRAAPGSA